MRRLLVIVLIILGGSAAAALAYAPYLPQAIIEGWPSLTWPAHGTFTQIAGATTPRELGGANTTGRPLVPDLDKAFVEAGGKALLLFHDGELALEHYGTGVTADTRLNSYSMAKSLVGALIYKALAEGKLTSFDVTLGELLPADKGLAHVTVRALLTMRSGILLEEDAMKFSTAGTKDIETALNPFGPLARLHFVGLGAIESHLVVSDDPEPAFSYQNVNTALLGAVLETLYQRPLHELMAEKIWRPAGAQPAF